MKSIITIGKGVIGEKLPIALITKIKKDLTFNNPDYVSAKKFGKYMSPSMPSHLFLFDIEGDKAWVPRGYIYWMLKWFKDNHLKYKIKDKTLVLKPLKLKFKGKLRSLQQKVIPDLMSYPCGVLDATTGAGKTVIGINMIVQRQQRTLIIVHSKELLYQWKDQIKKFTGEDAGLVGDGKFDIQPITIGIINSVRNKLQNLNKCFGHIICDEVHKLPSNSWMETLQEFRAKYYLGLSATLYRADGLGHAIFASIGPLKHKIDKKELQKTGLVLLPEIYKIYSNFSYLFTNDYSTMITSLINNEERNTLITNEIAQDLCFHKENILIVSDRQKHLKIMQERLLSNHKIKSHLLTGSINATKRKIIVKEARNGKCKVLFATTSLIGEGFDLPDLTALFLCTPIKFPGRLVQCVGRIRRPGKNKKKVPRVYDIRDDNIAVLQYSGYARDRVYKKM